MHGFPRKKEEEYFKNHPVYGKLKDQSHLGIPNMTTKISNILKSV